MIKTSPGRKLLINILAIILFTGILSGCGNNKTEMQAVFYNESTLVMSKEQTLIINAAEEDLQKLTETLKSRGIASVDALIITSITPDYLSAAESIVGKYDVDKLYFPDTLDESQNSAVDSILSESETTPLRVLGSVSFGIGDARVTVCSGDGQSLQSQCSSLIIKAVCAKNRMLLAADLHDEKTPEFIYRDGAEYNLTVFSDMSGNSFSAQELDKTDVPEISVIRGISAENGGTNGENTGAYLSERGSRVYYCGSNAIQLSCSGNKIVINQ